MYKKHKPLIVASILVVALSVGFILSLDFVFTSILKPHQQQRILVTLNQDVEEYYANKTMIMYKEGYKIVKTKIRTK